MSTKEPAIPRLGPLYLGMAMVTMADTILTIAMPSITAELSGARSYTALVTAYLLPQALATPVGGRLVDQYRPRRVVAISCLLYLAATWGCARATSMPELLLMRSLQGLGGGVLQASIYGMIDLLVPPRQQGQVQATAGVILGGGAALAPLIGGVITQHLGWRWCFYINLPAGALCLAYLWVLPDLAPRGKGSLDLTGIALLSAATIPLMLALTLGGVRLPWSSPPVISLVICALALARVFWWAERRRREPLFDPRVLRGGVFGWAALAYFCMGGAFLSCMLYLPLLMQVVRGLSPILAGLALLPFILGNIVGAVTQGTLVKRYGRYRPFALVGTASTALVFSLMVAGMSSPQIEPLWLMEVAVGVLGFTFGLGWDMYTLAVQNDTPANRQGMAGSAMDFIRQMGGSLGMALVGSFLIWSLDAGLPPELNRHLVPLGINLEVGQFTDQAELKKLSHEVLKVIQVDARRALQGDQQAYRRLEASAALSPGLKTRIRKHEHPSQQELDQEIRQAAARIDQAIDQAVAVALRRAQRHVCMLGGLLCVLAFLAAWQLPDRPLLQELIDEA